MPGQVEIFIGYAMPTGRQEMATRSHEKAQQPFFAVQMAAFTARFPNINALRFVRIVQIIRVLRGLRPPAHSRNNRNIASMRLV
jgi:hypothetical protein